MPKGILVLVVAAFALPVSASQPCRPLDCSDWVILQPGLTCTAYYSFPCSSSYAITPQCVFSNDDRALDSEGNLLRVRRRPNPANICNGQSLYRTELVAWTGQSETILAFVEERCAGPAP